MTVTDELRKMLTERGIEWRWEDERTTYWYVTVDGDEWGEWTAIEMGGYLHLSFSSGDVFTPEQAITATLGSDRLAFLEEKVRLQGDYIAKLTKENNALFAQSCEAATRHAGQIDAMQRKLEAATLGAGTCKADETDVIKCWVKCEDEPSTEHMELIHVMECSACGGTYEHVSGSYEFCPRCGRKVVDE